MRLVVLVLPDDLAHGQAPGSVSQV